jgi:EAL domain-containing protein (putative c-di-GMP-specific phosphodiesterase class I)
MELETLRALGVTLIQGFYLGRPAPPWPTPRVDLATPDDTERRAAAISTVTTS